MTWRSKVKRGIALLSQKRWRFPCDFDRSNIRRMGRGPHVYAEVRIGLDGAVAETTRGGRSALHPQLLGAGLPGRRGRVHATNTVSPSRLS